MCARYFFICCGMGNMELIFPCDALQQKRFPQKPVLLHGKVMAGREW